MRPRCRFAQGRSVRQHFTAGGWLMKGSLYLSCGAEAREGSGLCMDPACLSDGRFGDAQLAVFVKPVAVVVAGKTPGSMPRGLDTRISAAYAGLHIYAAWIRFRHTCVCFCPGCPRVTETASSIPSIHTRRATFRPFPNRSRCSSPVSCWAICVHI